jgi:PAS domain S-box-containing protein
MRRPGAAAADLQAYQARVQETLDYLRPVFAKASIGDFSQDVTIPDQDDEFTELYVGIQVMLEVIREQLARLQEDLAQEKQEERLLAEEKAKDEAMLESIGEGLVLTDAQGVVLMSNPSAEVMLGVPSKELVGRPWIEIVRLEDSQEHAVPTAERPIEKVIATRKRYTSSELTFVLPSGRRLPISLTATPVRVDDRLLGVIQVFRDITFERAIDRAKSEFVSLASHQLRTPLSTIKWYASMLVGDTSRLRQQDRSYVAAIYSSNERMIALVDALLNVSRLEMGSLAIEPKPTDIVQVAREIAAEFQPLMTRKRLHFTMNFDKLPRITLDRHLTHIILENLLSNAVKYTPENGRVSLSIRKDGSGLAISVEDNGYGIPQAEQDRIFSKLFRGTNVRDVVTEGTGLGLYTVKAVLDQTGGEVSFTSKEGEGSTFTVRLPKTGMKNHDGSKKLVPSSSVRHTS